MLNRSRSSIAVILLAIIIIIGIAISLGLRKSVTISINGQTQNATTYAFTVADLLHKLHIPLSTLDELSPAPDNWLKNGDNITIVRAIPIQILADGQIRSLYSAERTPTSLLTSAGVSLLPGDEVLSNGKVIDPSLPFPENISSLSLQIIRLVAYSFIENSKTTDLTSTAPTLGSALWAAGHSFYDSDQLNPPLYTSLTPGLSVLYKPSRQLTIHTRDMTVSTRTAADSVGEALLEAGLSIQGLDFSDPPQEAPVPSNGEIRLIHVTEEVQVEQSPLAFETQYQPDPDLEIDNQSIIQTGEYGLSAQRVRVRYEGGQEVSRQVENQWISRQPKPRIIGYGTSIVMQTTVVDGITIQYWRALNMYATSYHPAGVGNTTASGLPLKKGVAAIDTSIIPFYTQMYIPGYGEATAADIGGGVRGRMIDLGYSDDEYVSWHQWVTVYFLWPPPNNIVWIIP